MKAVLIVLVAILVLLGLGWLVAKLLGDDTRIN